MELTTTLSKSSFGTTLGRARLERRQVINADMRRVGYLLRGLVLLGRRPPTELGGMVVGCWFWEYGDEC